MTGICANMPFKEDFNLNESAFEKLPAKKRIRLCNKTDKEGGWPNCQDYFKCCADNNVPENGCMLEKDGYLYVLENRGVDKTKIERNSDLSWRMIGTAKR